MLAELIEKTGLVTFPLCRAREANMPGCPHNLLLIIILVTCNTQKRESRRNTVSIRVPNTVTWMP